MNREQAIRYLESSGFSEEQIDTIEQAFRQQPCEDAISRQAAIGIIQNWLNFDTGYSWGEKNVMKCAISELMDLPSISTEKPNRCKDCSFFQSREKAVYANTNGVKVTNGSHTCFYWDGSGVPEDGFCHNFEKMGVEE